MAVYHVQYFSINDGFTLDSRNVVLDSEIFFIECLVSQNYMSKLNGGLILFPFWLAIGNVWKQKLLHRPWVLTTTKGDKNGMKKGWSKRISERYRIRAKKKIRLKTKQALNNCQHKRPEDLSENISNLCKLYNHHLLVPHFSFHIRPVILNLSSWLSPPEKNRAKFRGIMSPSWLSRTFLWQSRMLLGTPCQINLRP